MFSLEQQPFSLSEFLPTQQQPYFNLPSQSDSQLFTTFNNHQQNYHNNEFPLNNQMTLSERYPSSSSLHSVGFPLSDNSESLGIPQHLSFIPYIHQPRAALTPKKSQCNLPNRIDFSPLFYQVEEIVDFFSVNDPNVSYSENQLSLKNVENSKTVINQDELTNNLKKSVFEGVGQRENFDINPSSNQQTIKIPQLELAINKDIFVKNNTNNNLNGNLSLSQMSSSTTLKEAKQNCIFEQDLSTQPEISTKDIEEKRPASNSFSGSSFLSQEDNSVTVVESQVKQNIFKSIINAFKCFLKEKKKIKALFPKNEKIDNRIKQLARFLKTHSFNHQVLKYIILHETYSIIFQYFIDLECSSWIKRSKILNKRAAYEVLSNLQSSLKDKGSIRKLICYKTSRKNYSDDRTESYESDDFSQ